MNLAGKILFIHRSGECGSDRMNQFVGERLRGIITQSAAAAGKFSVQKEQWQRTIHLQQNSGRPETGPPGRVPAGNPLRPETIFFPGQPTCRLTNLTGKRPAFPDERQQIGGTVLKCLQLSGEDFKTRCKRSVRLRGSGKHSLRIEFRFRFFPEIPSHIFREPGEK